MRRSALYTVAMMLCFIYGGISFFFFLTQIMPIVAPEFGPAPAFMERIELEPQNYSNVSMMQNWTPPARDQSLNATHERITRFQTRVTAYFLTVIFISLFGSAIAIVAGLAIYLLMRKKDRRELTKSVIDVVTTPEEKLVLKELEENGGQMTQAELAKRTKLTKVKIHRVVKRLESIGIVSKYSYGMTNKIKLEKKIFQK